MMTKDEARALLLKIEKLLAQAEPDGYIDLAFKGCVALAYNNIDNDWGCSPMDWREGCYNRDRELEELRAYKDGWQEKYNGTKSRYDEAVKENMELTHRAVEAEKRVQSLEDEVIRLKAKLYDMIERCENVSEV